MRRRRTGLWRQELGLDSGRERRLLSGRLLGRRGGPMLPVGVSGREDVGEKRAKGTAVIVSMQRTKGSENMYLESDSEYSFHSWPKKSVMLAIRV